MNNLFYTVLNMSITSSIIIALVIIIRLFFKNLPKKYSYILWSVVGFRLCVPYSFKSIISLFNIGCAINSNPIKTDNNKLSYVDKHNTAEYRFLIRRFKYRYNHPIKCLTLYLAWDCINYFNCQHY